MIRRPSLLGMTAAASALAFVANGATLASPSSQDVPGGAPKTRMGQSIAQDMSERDRQAAARKRQLDTREQAARAAEARLKSQMEAEKERAAAAGPAGAAGGEAAPEEAQYDDLAKIYQAMKPAKAAIVFEQLDMDVQMKVAVRMRERSMALILASMTPKGAAALTMALARKKADAGKTAATVTPGRPRK